MKINKSSNLGELIEAHPETAELLFEYGLHCGGCMAAGFDSIEEGAMLHGMTEEEIQEMIDDLNERLATKQTAENNFEKELIEKIKD